MPVGRRFEMDARAERAVGRVRLVAAVITLAAVGWLVASEPGTFGWVGVVLGASVGVGWIAAFLRSRKRAREASGYFLDLSEAGLTLAEGDRRHHIGWAEMTEVEVDEERLVVSVARRGGPTLTIQPRYPGVTLEELAAAIRDGRPGAGGPEMVK
jgi:hypothetical protein